MGKESVNFLKSKKAQQSNWFMIVLVLAVITLVVVALAITGAFDKIGNVFDQASDLEVAAQACNVYASQNMKTSYCRDFKEVELAGRTQYANCKYLEGYADFENKLECDSDVVENLISEFCTNKDLDDDEKVNEFTCGNIDGNPNNPADGI